MANQVVLWPSKPALFCKVDGDEDAKHYGAYVNKELVCVASIYTHDTSICKVSKANCAEILGIKLKPSRSKSKFYNDVDWCKLPCPTRRKFENQVCVATIGKGITITSYCA